MALFSVKVLLAFSSFVLGCMNIYYNTEVEENTYQVNEIIEKDDYYAYLRIPSIALSNPLYKKDDKRSNIDSNLIFVDASDTPLKKNGNVIIAGHSGASTVSYFKFLYKLEVDDLIFLEFDNEIYKYKVDNIYTVKKTGKVEIRRDTNTSSLTLVTCQGENKQLVVIANIVGQTKK